MKFINLIFILLFTTNHLFSQEDSLKSKALIDLSLEELMDVTIFSASKKLVAQRDAPALITLIDKDDINRFGANTLIDVLKYVPSIEVSIAPDGFYQIAMRGSRKESNLLVLINDQQINDFYDGKVIYDLPAQVIERIEIIRGPGSALFGNNAMSGIIHIYTKNTNDVQALVGLNNAYNVSYNAYKAKNNYTFSLNTNYHQNNTSIEDVFEDKSTNDPWSLVYNNQVFKTNRWNNSAFVQSKFTYKNFVISGGNITQNNGAYVGPSFIATKDSKYQKHQQFINISNAFKIADNVIIKPSIYAQHNIVNNFEQERPDGYISLISNQVFTDGRNVREHYKGLAVGGEVNIYIKVNDYLDYITGSVFEDLRLYEYELLRNYQIVGDEYKSTFGNYDNVAYNQLNQSRQIFAYYSQLNYTKDKWNITAGLRYDDFSDFGQSLNPRIGLNYKLNNHMSFKGLAGKAFRAPTFSELYDNTSLGNDFGVKGNVNLTNEKINTFEIGVELLYKKFILRYNLFHNQQKNLIRIYDPHGGGSIGSYENIGNFSVYGQEAEFILKLNENIYYNLNFSHFFNYFSYNEAVATPADYIFFENEPKYNQEIRNIPTTRLNSGLTLKYKKLTLFAGANYGNFAENNKRFYLEKFKYARIPSYLVGNFNISYAISPQFICALNLNNVGSKYSDPEESTNINAFGEMGLIQPGLFTNLNLKYTFK